MDEQVSQLGYGTSSEYVRELIRRDQDRQQLRGLLLAGVSSAPTEPVSESYFEDLRERVRGAARRGQSVNQSSPPAVSTKPVLPQKQARKDLDDVLAYYLAEDAKAAALGFIDALEQAYSHIGRHPAAGSPRCAHALNLPGLPSWRKRLAVAP